MPINDEEWNDNVFCCRRDGASWFFKIAFVNEDHPFLPFDVAISVYCVPGRLDDYWFGLDGNRKRGITELLFCAETGASLVDAASRVKKDLNRTLVVDMMVAACEYNGVWRARRLQSLLWLVAPDSKAHNAVSLTVRKMIAENRKKRLAEGVAAGGMDSDLFREALKEIEGTDKT